MKQKRYAEAEPLALSAYEVRRKTLGEDNQATRNAAAGLAEICDSTGRPREAAEWRAKAK